ncbi:MAG: hypothetical protein OHK0024_14860 [Thalassobaculales bacterium]
MDGDRIARVLQLLAVLLLAWPALRLVLRDRPAALRMAGYWLAFGGVLTGGYLLFLAR